MDATFLDVTIAERNQRIIDTLPGFIFIFDRNLIIRDAVIPPSAFLFHTVEQLRGMDGRNLYEPEVCNLFLENIHACLEDGKMKEIEYFMDFPDQSFYYQARIVPYGKDHALAMIIDITERIRRTKELMEAKRKAEEADRMKSLFLANMSHEIRTPLNAIVGFSEMISYAETDEEKQDYLNIIQRNSGLLLQLINDILDLSRMEAGKAEVHLTPVSFSSILSECAQVHELKMKEGVELVVDIPDHDFTIHTDHNRLTQVLSNFITNAIKHTVNGRITLGGKLDKEGVHLYVTDTGCGISEEDLPRIFHRFEKLNDFAQGTGLGLAICQTIAELLDGHIDVTSQLGVGSTFAITLPLSVCVNLPKVMKARKKVLIVTGVEIHFLQANAILRKEYEVFWARNTKEAMSCIQANSPQLVLVSLKGVEENPERFVEEFRTILTTTPVIAVAEHNDETDRELLAQLGFSALFTRPYSMEKLKEKVDELIM